jgi:predicted metal-dependent phosphotriesterase family hydrolase
MKDEQILKLAKTCGFDEFPDDITSTKEQLLKFARELYDEGYTKGFKVGHDAGWELNEEVSRRGL